MIILYSQPQDPTIMKRPTPIKTVLIPNAKALHGLIVLLKTRKDFLFNEFHDQIVIDEEANSGTIDEIIPCMNAFNDHATITTLVSRAIAIFSIFSDEGHTNLKFPILCQEELDQVIIACECQLDLSSDIAFEAIPTIQPDEANVIISRPTIIEKRKDLQRNINDVTYSAMFLGQLKY